MGQTAGVQGIKYAYAQAVVEAFEELHAALQQHLLTDLSAKQQDWHIRLAKSLRLQQGQHVTNIDHLVIHSRGFIVIENRSEPADLSVSPMGEWTQVFQGAILRVPSPIDRMSRKRQVLQQLMALYADRLELSIPEPHSLSYEGLVAIPNQGSLSLPSQVNLADVCKAAAIPERVLDMIAANQPAKPRLRLFTKPKPDLGKEDIAKIMSLLKSLHQPALEQRTIPEQGSLPVADSIVPTQEAAKPEYRCKSCGNDSVTVEHRGRYILLCSKCKQELDIERSCQSCGEPATIIRDGNSYHRVCESCHSSRDLHIEPCALSTEDNPTPHYSGNTST